MRTLKLIFNQKRWSAPCIHNFKGMTLAEVMVTLGIITLIGLGAAMFFSNFDKTANRINLVADASIELNLGSAFIFADLKGISTSLNILVLNDLNNRNFFDYNPNFIPDTGDPGTREIILALKGPLGEERALKYEEALGEVSFLRASKNFGYPLPLSPSTAYKQGSNCESPKCEPMRTNNCNIGDLCLKTILEKKELDAFGSFDQSQNVSPLYFFIVPEFFISSASCASTFPTFYFFLAKMNASGTLESMKNAAERSALDGGLGMRMIQPTSCIEITSLNQFFKQIPAAALGGTTVLFQKVEWVKYKLEKTNIKGRDSTRLIRTILNYGNNGLLIEESAPQLIAEGFEAIRFTRPSIKLPIIEFKFINQFELNKDKSDFENL